jgi:sporulation protein YlmC with PRC-barrel domain
MTDERKMVSIGELSWKKVVTSDGIEIGQLQGGEISQGDWRITHVHIGLDDDTMKKLGFTRPFLGRILICLPVSYIQSFSETVILNKSFEELKGTKECQEFTVT